MKVVLQFDAYKYVYFESIPFETKAHVQNERFLNVGN